MSRKLAFSFLVATIILAASASYIAYTLGIEHGTQEGYTQGFDTGYTEGTADGQQEGYQQGYTDGNTEGAEEGWDTGYDEGYTMGYTEGEDTGNTTGYMEGLDTGNQTGYEQGYTTALDDAVGHIYELRDPSYNEALRFIRKDPTNKNEYNDSFQCRHYSAEVISNAKEQGIISHYVYIGFNDSAHAIVAFNTTDRGLVYFEPQDDAQVYPRVSVNYFDRDKYIVDFDDIIREIIVIP